MISKCGLCFAKWNDSKKKIRSYRLKCRQRDPLKVSTLKEGTKFSYGSYLRQSREESSSNHQVQPDEETISTQVSRNMRHDKRSHLSDAIQARLGPQVPSAEGQSCMSETLRARLGPLAVTPMSEGPSQLLRQQVEVSSMRAPPDFINRRLNDMFFTSFGPHIIKYKTPRGFVVPKFAMYDGMSDPFDHIMHFRQLTILDIGNDALMCKVFLASLHGPTLSWFHRLQQNFVNKFWDISEAFVGNYLCSTRQKQNISTL